MRTPQELQATVTAETVKIQDDRLILQAQLCLELPMPVQDADLPKRLEAGIERGGQMLKRRLFQHAIEQADAELILARRHGKPSQGIICRGVHPAEARAGVANGGHADSTGSCVRGLRTGRSACPSACCITPLASAATTTLAPTTRTAKRSSPSTKSPRPAADPPAGPPRSSRAVGSSGASEPCPSAAAPPSWSCPSRASNARPVAWCDRSRSPSPTRAAATPTPSSATPWIWVAA